MRKNIFNLADLFSTLRIAVLILTLAGSFVFPVHTRALGVAIQVNTAADNTTEDGLCSLREAIINANHNWQFYKDCDTGFSDDGIYFSDTLGTTTITLTSILPIINDPNGLYIDGGSDITIDGNNLYQAFSIHSLGAANLNNLTIKNGNSQITGVGGAVYNAGKLGIHNCHFINNQANNAGGAIFTGFGTLIVQDSYFDDNHSEAGGAIYNEGGSVTIQGGEFFTNYANNGGAIMNNFSSFALSNTISIMNVSLANNKAKYGGAIYNTASAKLYITQSSILKNTASSDGGGIYNKGNLDISGGHISSNSAKTGAGLYNEAGLTVTVDIFGTQITRNVSNLGAGIYNKQTGLSIYAPTFSENIGVALYNYGGNVMVFYGAFNKNSGHAIYNHGEDNIVVLATLRVTGTLFSNNSGVGIYNDFGKSNVFTSRFQKNGSSGVYSINSSLVSIDRSSFVGNVGKYGGGIYSDDSILHVHNSTLYGNYASYGGAIYNTGDAYILSSTMALNSAELYDGVYSNSPGDLEIYNTIIAKSAGAGTDCTNVGGMVTGNNNLIQSSSAACGFVDGVNNNLIGYDPNFGILTGSPAYLPIDLNSLAIDRGDDLQCAAVSNQSQNGVTRPQGSHCDIGSYEAPFTSFVSSQSAVNDLVEKILSFSADGAISVEDEKTLFSLLEVATNALNSSDNSTALKDFDGFSTQVKLMIDSRNIKPEYGQEFLDIVQILVKTIQ